MNRNVLVAAFTVFLMLGIGVAAEMPFVTRTGDPLPRFSATTIDGDEWSSGDEAKATVILVVDPESTISRELLPPFEEFFWQNLKDNGVRVLVIARDADEAQAKELANELGLTFPLAADPKREMAQWFAEEGKGVPRIIIASAENNIVYQHAGYSTGREAEFYYTADAVLSGEAIPQQIQSDQQMREMPLGAQDIRGKKAPEVHVEKWITRKPGDMENKYVMTEFWATWCGPCIQMMPHLDQMAKDRKDQMVIRSISDEPAEVVSKFVAEKGFTYPIGVDTQDRTRQELQVMGIPHAFIENPEGIVVWQGHPGELHFDDEILDKILSGEYKFE